MIKDIFFTEKGNARRTLFGLSLQPDEINGLNAAQ